MWERRKENTLETTFAADGAVLLQRHMKLNDAELNGIINETLIEAKISKVSQKEYSDVKISKSCPKCGADTLQRYVEAFASKDEIPVMPIYYCNGCTTKSFYLTNQYLEYLVETNRELFEENEKLELERDKSKAIGELREYIIRMFASKKILNIK